MLASVIIDPAANYDPTVAATAVRGPSPDRDHPSLVFDPNRGPRRDPSSLEPMQE
jgi:hypothetical protein